MIVVAKSSYAQGLKTLHLPRHDEIPPIDLYMDQLLNYLHTNLAPLYGSKEKILTSSMVNNYVKQGVLPAATSKKYKRTHIAYLMVICTLKQTFTISEIEQLIGAQIASFETAIAYDYFCSSFEAALQTLFDTEEGRPLRLTGTSGEGDFERDLVLSTTAAVAYTLYVKASLSAMRDNG